MFDEFVISRLACCAPPARPRRCQLLTRHVFLCCSAGLAELCCVLCWLSRFLLDLDFFEFGSLPWWKSFLWSCVHDGYVLRNTCMCFYYIFTKCMCTHVRHFNILLSKLVLVTFSIWHQQAIKVMTRKGLHICRGIHFVTHFQCVFIVCILHPFDVVFAKLQNTQRTCRNLKLAFFVTFGALSFWTSFGVLTRYSTYVLIYFILCIQISHTTLRVRFCARYRSVPLSFLYRRVSRTVPPGDRLGCQRSIHVSISHGEPHVNPWLGPLVGYFP